MGSSPPSAKRVWSFGADHIEPESAVRRIVRGLRRCTLEGVQHLGDVGWKEKLSGLDPN